MSKLKERREELHLTQKEIAEKVGITYQSYQRYERCSILPNVQIALKIAKALYITVEELYGWLE
nr:MAG TPA: hypothetical protein [Caudoviricetes sp.]